MKLTTCIPCYNNAETLESVVDSIRDQSIPSERLFIIDDASSDASCEVATKHGCEVQRMSGNSGRGAVRARAIDECQTELLLSCDATNALNPGFLERALPWFHDSAVAAVFGRIVDPDPTGMAGRWRARHLFLQGIDPGIDEKASLCTWAYVCRADSIRKVGNFRRNLRHSEDVELGNRLLKAGYKVVLEPSCVARPLVPNTVGQCLERHWRWHVARGGRMDADTTRRWLGLAWRSMVAKDLRAGDPLASAISLWLPVHHWRKSRS